MKPKYKGMYVQMTYKGTFVHLYFGFVHCGTYIVLTIWLRNAQWAKCHRQKNYKKFGAKIFFSCETFENWPKMEGNRIQKIFFFFQPLLGASQYHWLSDYLGSAASGSPTTQQRDLHFLCSDGCQDPFRALPSLLTTKIIHYLDPLSLVRCKQVCHHWHHLFNSEWI